MRHSTAVEDSNPGVWIIGNTLLMDGVAACLRELNIKNLVHWKVISADCERNLNASHPKLIVFERDTPGASDLLGMLAKHPGTHLLGIDLNCNQVLIMNSMQVETRSMSDLLRIVEDVAGGRE